MFNRIRSAVLVFACLVTALAFAGPAAATESSVEASMQSQVADALAAAPGPSYLDSTVTVWEKSAKYSEVVKNIKPFATGTWSVSSGYWSVWAALSGDDNCNGALPGNGNYTFGYKITY